MGEKLYKRGDAGRHRCRLPQAGTGRGEAGSTRDQRAGDQHQRARPPPRPSSRRRPGRRRRRALLKACIPITREQRAGLLVDQAEDARRGSASGGRIRSAVGALEVKWITPNSSAVDQRRRERPRSASAARGRRSRGRRTPRPPAPRRSPSARRRSGRRCPGRLRAPPRCPARRPAGRARRRSAAHEVEGQDARARPSRAPARSARSAGRSATALGGATRLAKNRAVAANTTPWARVPTITKVDDSSSGSAPRSTARMPTTTSVPMMPTRKPDRGEPRRPGGLALGALGQLGRVRRRHEVPWASMRAQNREGDARRASARTRPRRAPAPRAVHEHARGCRRRARPRRRCPASRPRARASPGSHARQLERRPERPPAPAWPRPTLAEETAPSTSSHEPRPVQPLRQRAVPVAGHHQRAARARAGPPARAPRRGRARTPARRASPRAPSPGSSPSSPSASCITAAQSSRRRSSPAAVAALACGGPGSSAISAREAALGAPRRPTSTPRRAPPAAARSRGAGRLAARTSVPERVEQHRADGHQAMKCQVANWAVKQAQARPPRRRPRGPWRRAPRTPRAIHMKIGNSTTQEARQRHQRLGRDRDSSAAASARRPRRRRRRTAAAAAPRRAATTANTRKPNSIRFTAATRNGSPPACSK